MTYGSVNTDSIVSSTGGTISPNITSLRNRIINGAMMIDQRDNGASVTINTGSGAYTLDRWGCYGVTSTGVYTVQQSSTAPAGFVNSIIATVTTADTSIGSTSQYVIQQVIEGYNVADLNWGTSNAKTVTLSFWVRSSLTGTFGGSLRNSDVSRSYPFSYTISSANTWTQISVTVTGDTSGTWLSTNSAGIRVTFSLGSGSSLVGTAGAWNSNNNTGVTGQTNLIATNGSTWYVTGVQLEVGTQATSFDYRPYGTELILCQRYYYNVGNTPAIGASGYHMIAWGWCRGGDLIQSWTKHPVTMRTNSPAVNFVGSTIYWQSANSYSNTATFTYTINSSASSNQYVWVDFGALSSIPSDGLIAYIGGAYNTSSYLEVSAEL